MNARTPLRHFIGRISYKVLVDHVVKGEYFIGPCNDIDKMKFPSVILFATIS